MPAELSRSSVLSYESFMNIFSFSADQYLDFIENSPKFAGKKVTPVLAIRQGKYPTDYVLIMQDHITLSDTLQIWIRDRLDEKIIPLTASDFHTKPHTLTVRDESGRKRSLANLEPGDITVVSDLSFLIQRLRDFYAGAPFSFMPPVCEPLGKLPEAFAIGLSEEQAAAINGACSSPLSFISGAPGTGKTNMVLSRCILRYILGGQRVLLLAPTHNAVEQMLRGILPVLKSAGVPLTRAYRIGPSSADFANEYPEVIGDTNLEQLKNALMDQRQRLSVMWNEVDRYNIRINKLSLWLESFRDIYDTVSLNLDQLQELKEDVDRHKAELRKATFEKAKLNTALRKAKAAERDAVSLVFTKQDAISRYTRLSEKLSYRLFHRKERDLLLSRISELQKELLVYKEEREKAIAHTTHTNTALIDADRQCEEITNALQKAENSYNAYAKHILTVAESEPAAVPVVKQCLNSASLSLTPLEDHIRNLQDQLDILQKDAPPRTIKDLHEEMELLDSQLQNIGNSAKLRQKGEALVLAGTIDGSLRDLRPEEKDIPISHVFLDEAGYTSLAKAAAAFTCNAPITFLGDHHQLQPICEMNNIPPTIAPVCLWALSAAYLSELLQAPFEHLYEECYCRSEAPTFSAVDHFSLNTSYRFGNQLASILADHIYGKTFQGVADIPFEIVVLDAPYAPGPLKNSSRSEANAIKTYIWDTRPTDFAVLAPYRGQCTYLQKVLGWEHKENILTVHRSQGREWDTVILSVVDGRSPFFTNSELRIGKCLINTAISRAKHRLVIVCDTMMWEQMSNQLIHKLIKCAPKTVPSLDALPFY